MNEKLLNLKKSFKELKWYEWVMAAIMIFIAGQAMVVGLTTGAASGNPAWLTVINFISAVCGVVCIFFCAKANISNFAFGLINTLVYAIYLFYWQIYGTFALEMLFYLPMNILSWWNWAKHRDKEVTQKTMTKALTIKQNIICIAAVTIGGIIIHHILATIGGTVPWLDAFTVTIGIIATILELFRYREQYVWWLITDVVAVAMYVIKFDPVYLTKKSIYLIMAIIGLINWYKLHKLRNAKNE